MLKKRSLFLSLCVSLVLLISSCTHSFDNDPVSGDSEITVTPVFSTDQLMTAQDVVSASYSNISIRNGAGESVTASGLYIASFDVNDCSVCSGSIVGGNNAFGAVVGQVSFGADQSIKIGQNYLYNMIYNGIYAISTTVGTPPCLLPGCSWPGDNPSITGWCLSIGVMSRNSTYTSSAFTNGSNSPANAVPYGEALTSGGYNYNYNLIDPTTLGAGETCLGPIVCDDATLTCAVSAAQTQTFQSY